MEYKRVTFAVIIVALILAGSLATLDNKKILSGQYQRYTNLVQQADRFFSNRNYAEASNTYRQALTIDPRDARLWAKFEKSQRKTFARQVQNNVPESVPQNITPQSEPAMPTSPSAGGMIIEEDEGC